MRSFLLLLPLMVSAGCSVSSSPEPSLAPRAAEATDPRLPIPSEVPSGTLDPGLAARLSALVAAARSAAPEFDAREAEAGRLAAAAGASGSESWIAAEQALSRLIEQHGATTRAAADIDALAASRLESQKWIAPADREAIEAAADEVSALNARQSQAIGQLQTRLTR